MEKRVISRKLDKLLCLKIPSEILLLYDELLVKTAVPERSHFLYKKWLKYYLNEMSQIY